jgi:DNA-binding FadR family transcriptional regulator
METIPTSEGRANVLRFIQREVKAGRPFPTARSIAEHMHWRPDSARDALLGLAADGCLQAEQRKVGRQVRWVFTLPTEEGTP